MVRQSEVCNSNSADALSVFSTPKLEILLVSVDSCENMPCILSGGFFEVMGTERMSSLLGTKAALFRSLSPSASSLYGSGFSYKDAFDEWDEGINH